MATRSINLAQAGREIENGWDVAIKVGSFETFNDFMSYYEHHYKPLLEAIRNGETLDAKQRHLLNFMADDLIQGLFETDEDC